MQIILQQVNLAQVNLATKADIANLVKGKSFDNN